MSSPVDAEHDPTGVPGPVRLPVEVETPAVVFPVVARGYERRRVDAYLTALEQELAELRWELDDLAAQRAELAAQRAAQARWEPSFGALGSRVVEVLRLAEQEAVAVREQADQQVRRREREATADLVAARAQAEQALEQTRRDADRERRAMELAAQERQRLLDGELARVRRDAELEVRGRLSQAAARARDVVDRAEREAAALRVAARAEVAALQRRRDELAADLGDLSARLVAVVHRLDRDDAPPLDVRSA